MTACKNSFECDARSDLTSATEAGTLVEYDGAFPRGETLHFFTILRLISGAAPCLMRFAEAEKESRSREKKTTSNEKGKEHEAKNGEPRL